MRAKPWIGGLPEYIPGKTLEEIREKYGLSQVYKLASNENIFGPCKEVKELIENSKDIINYYPDADNREIRDTLSSGLEVKPENIIMGNGTDQIIEMLCDCFIGKGDNIVISDPTFLIYEKAALKCGGDVIKVSLDSFNQDVRAITEAINKDTRIVFFTNPHNPAGTRITGQDLEFALENIPDDVIVALDEAYYEYLRGDARLDTIKHLDTYKNIIILRTFSKIYGLAGLRIGYGIADSGLISVINKIRLPFNVNLLAQRAAVKAFKNQEYIEEISKKVELEKQKFYNALDEIGAGYVGSYANFILIDVSKTKFDMAERLLENGFIVRPGKNLGVPGYIRVTISLPHINDKFIKAFVKLHSQ